MTDSSTTSNPRQSYPDSEEYRVRPIGVRSISAISITLIGLIVVGIGASALPSSARTLGGVILLLITFLAAARSFRISLVATRREIVIRNYFTTYRLRWEDIRTVGVGVHHFFVQAPAVAFKTRQTEGWITALATVAGDAECRHIVRALKTFRPDLSIEFLER